MKTEYSPRLPPSAPAMADPTAPVPPPPQSSSGPQFYDEVESSRGGGAYYYQDMNADVMVFNEDGGVGGNHFNQGGNRDVSGDKEIQNDVSMSRPKTSVKN